MGLFYDRSEQTENGKKYLVLKAKPIPHRIVISLILIVFILYTLSEFDIVKNKVVLLPVVLLAGGIFLVLIVIATVEARGSSSAYFKNKTVIKKGGMTISSVHPSEVWIEK